MLLEAAAQLRDSGLDFRLKFIGDGPERGRLEELMVARGLSGRVTFLGFLRGDQLERATQDVAVVLMPSIWEETAGLAVIEQMMRGRLVIASDIGGVSEIVGEAGLKFTAGDVDQLTACMRRVLDEPSLVSEIGRQARSRSLGVFQEENMVHAHLQLYREMLQ
jgi:glycosyltransferase involved in cell wall biosynthesis